MISRFLERKPQCLRPLFAGRAAKSGPGSYRSVSSLARQETPGYSANPAFRACGSAAKVTANPPPVRGRTGHAAFLRSARAGGCTPGMPASCLRQGRKGHSKAPGADVYYPLDQARPSAAAPWREETAEALRRGRAFSSRSSAAFSRRSKARIAQREHPPRRDSGGTPPRIAQREHPLKKGPFAGSFFAC